MYQFQSYVPKLTSGNVFLSIVCRTLHLLICKLTGFGVGKWNGFGGKVEPNETIIAAAVREMREESCVSVKASNLINVAHLEFTFEGDPVLMDVRVFLTNVFEGTPKETEEMVPKWFKFDEIPYMNMWPDDRMWFPYMLKGQPIFAKFHYQGFDKILNYEIKEVESMEVFYSTYK